MNRGPGWCGTQDGVDEVTQKPAQSGTVHPDR